jgi:hypothetical protein
MRQMTFDAFLASIESPALRAIAQHWNEARGSALLPSWEALRLEQLPQQAKLIWVYAYDPGTGKFTGQLSGEQITRSFGKSFRGLPLEIAHTGAIYLWVYQALTRVVTEPAAYKSSGHLYKQAGRIIEGERIALPLGSDGRTGDGVIGASWFMDPYLEGPIELLAEKEIWCPLRGS